MQGLVTLLILTLAALFLLGWFRRARRAEIVYAPFVGLLYRDGKFERQLPPGRYRFFDPSKRVHIGHIWMGAAMPVPLGDLTVVSRDQFAFRIAVSPMVEVVDPRVFAESQPSSREQYYTRHPSLIPLGAAAALEVVAGHDLREMIADPTIVRGAIQQRLQDSVPGARVTEILVTAITLPPETRKMFTEVERSKLEAQAALERARGEQASLRALANAARLVKDNPALANLRLLQTIEHGRGPTTIVLGEGALGPNGVTAAG